tara:strand:+ start:1419 stop:2195 length:777 start_codon:yes stop_codon:yes gene_type:complete
MGIYDTTTDVLIPFSGGLDSLALVKKALMENLTFHTVGISISINMIQTTHELWVRSRIRSKVNDEMPDKKELWVNHTELTVPETLMLEDVYPRLKQALLWPFLIQWKVNMLAFRQVWLGYHKGDTVLPKVVVEAWNSMLELGYPMDDFKRDIDYPEVSCPLKRLTREDILDLVGDWPYFSNFTEEDGGVFQDGGGVSGVYEDRKGLMRYVGLPSFPLDIPLESSRVFKTEDEIQEDMDCVLKEHIVNIPKEDESVGTG